MGHSSFSLSCLLCSSWPVWIIAGIINPQFHFTISVLSLRSFWYRFETQEKLIIVGTIHNKPKPDHVSWFRLSFLCNSQILNDESDSLLQRLILRFWMMRSNKKISSFFVIIKAHMLRLGNASLASASHSGQIQRGGACTPDGYPEDGLVCFQQQLLEEWTRWRGL